jgi:hypothetical protein
MTDKPQFGGLPLSDLIGGPLTAASDAQVRLANAPADFIKSIGEQPPADPAAPPTDGEAPDTGADLRQIAPRNRLLNPKLEVRGPNALIPPFTPTQKDSED